MALGKLFSFFLSGLIFFGCTNQNGITYYGAATPTPGTFVGIWSFPPSSFKCTTIVSVVDTAIQATVTNDSTGEILKLSGSQAFPQNAGDLDFFLVRDSSNLFGTVDSPLVGTGYDLYFSSASDTLHYKTIRKGTTLEITCVRK